MTVCRCLLLRSLLGVKRTWGSALHMSAYDPKRTSRPVQLPMKGDREIGIMLKRAAKHSVTN
jgi:hypothetical protein